MKMIIHPTSKIMVHEEDFKMFTDWETTKFINAIECQEVETDKGFAIKGIINGETFTSELTQQEYFEGNNFTL